MIQFTLMARENLATPCPWHGTVCGLFDCSVHITHSDS